MTSQMRSARESMSSVEGRANDYIATRASRAFESLSVSYPRHLHAVTTKKGRQRADQSRPN